MFNTFQRINEKVTNTTHYFIYIWLSYVIVGLAFVLFNFDFPGFLPNIFYSLCYGHLLSLLLYVLPNIRMHSKCISVHVHLSYIFILYISFVLLAYHYFHIHYMSTIKIMPMAHYKYLLIKWILFFSHFLSFSPVHPLVSIQYYIYFVYFSCFIFAHKISQK